QEIIPYPNHYEQKEGKLSIPKVVTISAESGEFNSLIPGFVGTLQNFSVRAKETRKKGWIQLVRNAACYNPEEYRLTISPEGIIVEAGCANGCFYGLQSALQLISNAGEGGSIPCAVIHDTPRYGWRGMMLDESRHFIGKAEVKKLLDFMALHKLNKFHWHLTDSQGWRVEIRRYPLLTSVGAVGNLTDPNAPAQYYTQAEIAGIVKYAQDRFIEIIPEIDMPGHATSAVKAYPEFSGGGSKQYPDFTFNPGKEGTYTFLTDILKEITNLFPSKYIHIGGDEVHFGNEQWNYLPDVRNIIKSKGLKDLVAVEHYFLNRMSDSIRTLNKTVVGWDEVVTAGLPVSNTVVMWWRQERPEQLGEAISKGYEIVMCPRLPLYFDFVQYPSHKYGRKWSKGEYAPIERVYHFPGTEYTSGISVSTPLIKGIQGNVWTEVIHTPERLQFMVYPRLSALAEAAWTQDSSKNYENFNLRMNRMMNIYNKSGITFFNYKNPDLSPEVAGPGKREKD
ncbi:MAG: beta-N-acetylhexosaminidase, partial [Petrimonas sp.]|uniref:beta-N-acetylhexosaminidase n=1 Tax=Petrimonas sp. TaxID=2023866 RepID=UPI002B3E3E2C|nr:beta-N-acetylhexosaminidase [Petrimonas sp.]MEA5043090.1 beta-N-acetylhexosaminidase [Petrimonas sp.]MEA5062498.1 beta-N-acetylhexosaminidase [Petrimonas sp.]